MPDFGSRATLPGWEPGAPFNDQGPPQQWYGLGKLLTGGTLEWVKEIPPPAPNVSDPDEPVFAPAGGVGINGGVVFGVFSGDGASRSNPIHKFIWFYRYDSRGNEVEKVELRKQNFFRTYTGNDLIIDKEGRLWWMAYPTLAGLEENLAQVYRMPEPEE